MKNYRPVSNLTYISKLIEKVVVKRLNSHMTLNNLHEYFQSAYRPCHSTVSALLKVVNDLLQAVDGKQCCFLVLLDLSAAFDTVEHDVLLQRFQETVGIHGSALNWCRSYFADRTQSVNVLGTSSRPRPLESGMPQGSVVGPFGFPTYTRPLGAICRKYGISYHFYADDTQLYVAFKPGDELQTKERLESCISEIREWMGRNFLKLNDSKTEFVIIGSNIQRRGISTNSVRIGDQDIAASESVRNIGAMLDCQLSMKPQVSAVCRGCYYHIRNIGKVRRNLTEEASVSLVHAFITSRVDYLNALIYGVPQSLIAKLQKIQNTAARIISRKKRRDHITPILSNLHWLPVQKRIEFKILLFTFKALHGLAPGYIKDLITPYQPTRSLRSQNLSFLRKPISRTKSFGDRSFAYAAPHLWNKLPQHIRTLEDLDEFKSSVKTQLYREAYEV